MKINGVSFYGTPTRFSPSVFFDTYHWLFIFIPRHVSDFPTWVKVGDRRASGILSGPLSTSGYFGFSFTLRYRAISTTVFLRFTDFNLRNFWRTAFVASWIFVGNRFPTLFDGRISLLRGHSSAINGFLATFRADFRRRIASRIFIATDCFADFHRRRLLRKFSSPIGLRLCRQQR